MDRIILFTSYYFAKKAEEVMKESHIEGQLIATPPALHNACGLCIILVASSLYPFLSLLREKGISHSGAYTYSSPFEPSHKVEIDIERYK